MRYRVRIYDHELPVEMQADPIEVEADREPDLESDPNFIIFHRAGARVALFRRDHVRAVHEVSGGRPG
jgi:hypothetical protein